MIFLVTILIKLDSTELVIKMIILFFIFYFPTVARQNGTLLILETAIDRRAPTYLVK